MAKAVELSIARSALITDLAIRTNAELVLGDHAEVANTYYQWLHHALEHGTLPAAALELIASKKREGPPTK